MALIAHFPLTGNLDNLVEGSSIALTNNGATVSPYGKLGQCYEFKGVESDHSDILFKPQKNDDLTFSLWINVKKIENKVFFGAGFKLGLKINSGKWCLVSWGEDAFNICDAEVNKWTHFSCIFSASTSKKKLYKNGVLVSETPYARSVSNWGNVDTSIALAKYGGYSTTSEFFSSFEINDFKIFDHALTPAEVAGLTASRKLLNSDGVERIAKNIKSEMEKRGNKPSPLPAGATFAADFTKSLCAWTPNGIMELNGFSNAYQSELGVYKNGLTAGNKLDIQQTDKGVWIGYGSENLIQKASSMVGVKAEWISANKVKVTKTATSTSAYYAFKITDYNFEPNTRFNFKFKVLEKSNGSNLRIGPATGTVWKEGANLISVETGKVYEYFRTTVDNISELTNVRMFHVYPNSGSATINDYAIIEIFMEENPINTPYVEKSRGISTLCYPHKFTDVGTTTVIKFWGKIHEGSYKGTNTNYHFHYLLSNGSDNQGLSLSVSNKSILNSHLTDGLNTLVIHRESTNRTFVNGKEITNVIGNDEREVWEKTGYTLIGKRNASHADSGDSASQTHWSQLFHFNRLLTEKEIYDISNNDIEVPLDELSAKSLNKFTPAEKLSWNGIRDNYDSIMVSGNTVDVILKPSKTYIVTDSNGAVYKSKISSIGAVSAGTGSTNVLTNTAGMIRVTGSVAFPVNIEVI